MVIAAVNDCVQLNKPWRNFSIAQTEMSHLQTYFAWSQQQLMNSPIF